MAILKNTNIDDTGFLQLPVGTTAQRPGTPSIGDMRFNTTIDNVEIYDTNGWKPSFTEYDGPGSSESNPATSALAIQNSVGSLPNGFYWIKPTAALTAYYTYCDFHTEGGGWTAIQYKNWANRSTIVGELEDTTHNSAGAWRPNLAWRRALATTYPFYMLHYITNQSTLMFDGHSAENFAVTYFQNSGHDPRYNTYGGNETIPGYGKMRGYEIINNSDGFFNSGRQGIVGYPTVSTDGQRMRWWNYSSGADLHLDSTNLAKPDTLSSEDNWGWFGTGNSNHMRDGQWFVRMIRQ